MRTTCCELFHVLTKRRSSNAEDWGESDQSTQLVEGTSGVLSKPFGEKQCLGNETFMVVIDHEKMLVLCFDPDIRMDAIDHFTMDEKVHLA